MIKAGIIERPKDPIPEPFKFKYPNLPLLKSYKGTFPDDYWSNWKSNPYTDKVNSWISWPALEYQANRVGYQDTRKLEKARSMLLYGAKLDCEGTGRLPTRGENSPSVALNGAKFADQLQDWCATGIVAGPIHPDDMPFHHYKISPMGVTPKPHGKIRIVMDLSFPHDIPRDDPRPNSVNMGIDKTKLHSRMATTQEVCLKIWNHGNEAQFAKADWSNAYKHISLDPADRPLQFFQFGGRYFCETQLTFGSSSSPDRFDCMSDIPLGIALKDICQSKDLVAKALDDVVAVDRESTGVVGQFYDSYRTICKKVGISLAGEEHSDKAFSPRSEGIVLGIWYNLRKLEWSIPAEKANKILSLLWDAVLSSKTSYGTIATITGKLTHYQNMVLLGKWERTFILRYLDYNRPPYETVSLDKLALDQLRWWIKSINLAKNGSRIPDPRTYTPRVYLTLCSDASGGLSGALNGIGSCFMTGNKQPWCYMNWTANVRNNLPNRFNVKFAFKLSTLEAFAATMGLISEPDLIRGKRVVIETDNSGFVYAYANGNSTCVYLHSICKALRYICLALNTTLYVEKVKRRTGPGPTCADELSKGNIKTGLLLLSDPMSEPSRISPVLFKWISDPKPSRTLGEEVIDEIASFTKILDWGQF